MKFTGEYPPDWKAIAWSVKKAADWRCQRCHHPAGGMDCDEECTHPVDGRQRMLTVHHLDNDKSNCRWWNLVALCQVCHLQIQGRVLMAQGYMFPHTGWFRIYVAGWHAYCRGLPDDREYVEAHLAVLLTFDDGEEVEFYANGNSET